MHRTSDFGKCYIVVPLLTLFYHVNKKVMYEFKSHT